MSKRKARLMTAMMAIGTGAAILCIFMLSEKIGNIIAYILAVYGFAMYILNTCRWLMLPEREESHEE